MLLSQFHLQNTRCISQTICLLMGTWCKSRDGGAGWSSFYLLPFPVKGRRYLCLLQWGWYPCLTVKKKGNVHNSLIIHLPSAKLIAVHLHPLETYNSQKLHKRCTHTVSQFYICSPIICKWRDNWVEGFTLSGYRSSLALCIARKYSREEK